MTLKHLFLDHPRSIGETYVEHCAHALLFAGGLFFAAIACSIHAFVPAMCEATASRALVDLNDRMTARRRGSQPLGVAKSAG